MARDLNKALHKNAGSQKEGTVGVAFRHVTEDEADVAVSPRRLKTERPVFLDAYLKRAGYEVDRKTGAVRNKRTGKIIGFRKM